VLPNLQNPEGRRDKREKLVGYPVYDRDERQNKIAQADVFFDEDLDYVAKSMKDRSRKGNFNQQSVSQLFIDFFHFYAFEYSDMHAIAIYEQYGMIEKGKAHDNLPFSIYDPFDANHNPGRTVKGNSRGHQKIVNFFHTIMKKFIEFTDKAVQNHIN
jgi:DNA polymerase sigma